MKAKALLLGTLLSAFMIAVACNGDGATETPADGTETPVGTTEPTSSPTGGTPDPGTLTPGTLTPGTLTPGTLTPGTLTPGTLTPGTLTPGTIEPTASPSGSVPLGTVVFVPLSEVNASGESGAAILVPMGDTTLVAIGIETSMDLAADAAIHAGPCSTLGDEDTPLAALANSTSLTIVNMRAEELTNQELSIVLIEAGGTVSDAIACGDIP